VPKADLEKSFDAAVRHLFRHLDSAEALRGNPLVRFAFRPPPAKSRHSDRAALSLIRSALLDAGHVCYAEDLEAGRKAQAEIQSVILATLVSRCSAAKAASDLCISVRQFYRYRRDICTRLARLLARSDPKLHEPAQLTDPFRLLLQRAALLVDGGFAGKAVAELERSLGEVSSKDAHVAMLLALCNAETALGHAERAEDFLRAAGQMARRRARANCDPDFLQISLDLAEFRVARLRIDGCRTDTLIDSLMRECHAADAQTVPNELRVEILIELCRLRTYEGRNAEARDAIDRAAALDRRIRNAAQRYRIQIACEAAFCRENTTDRPDERLSQITDALELSVAAGSGVSTLSATLGLARHYANVRVDDQAKAIASQALQIARLIEGSAYLASTSIDIANILLRTSHWRLAGPLLNEMDGHTRPGSWECLGLNLFRGVLLARNGRYSDALSVLAAAESIALTGCSKAWLSAVLREMSTVLHALGRAEDARDRIGVAVSLAETSAGAPSQWQTYRTAGMILGDRQMLSLADKTAALVRGTTPSNRKPRARMRRGVALGGTG
jgi:tetratricopeptide (TPR) repeat protein